LQKCSAFPHGATLRAVSSWTSIAGDARTIGFVSAPIDVAFVVVLNEHGPLGDRQLADALLAPPGGVERGLETALAIRICACAGIGD
jgi:hypothetical protein